MHQFKFLFDKKFSEQTPKEQLLSIIFYGAFILIICLLVAMSGYKGVFL